MSISNLKEQNVLDKGWIEKIPTFNAINNNQSNAPTLRKTKLEESAGFLSSTVNLFEKIRCL